METVATTNGEIIIPSSVGNKVGVKEGTRVQIEVDEETQRILLKPMKKDVIDSLFGILKANAEEKLVTEELLEDHKKEIEDEERRFGRNGS